MEIRAVTSVVRSAGVWEGTKGGLFIATRATTAIALYYSFPKLLPKDITKENTFQYQL
jgi:hypothetical protein